MHPLNDELLAAYFSGLLKPTEERALHRQLRDDPEAARLIASLGLLIKEEDVQGSVPEALTRAAQDLWPEEYLAQKLRLAVRWLGEQLAPLSEALQPVTPAHTLLRGGAAIAAQEELRYQLSLGELPLEIDLEVEGFREVSLAVRPLQSPQPGLLLRLSCSGQTQALSSLTQGRILMEALRPGDYELSLERGEQVLGQLSLLIEGEAQHLGL